MHEATVAVIDAATIAPCIRPITVGAYSTRPDFQSALGTKGWEKKIGRGVEGNLDSKRKRTRKRGGEGREEKLLEPWEHQWVGRGPFQLLRHSI